MKYKNLDLSFLHHIHIQKERKKKHAILFLQMIILTAPFLLWEVASRCRWIDPLLFSSPSSIFRMMSEKFSDHSLYPHIWTTLLETIAGFVLGTILGMLIATILWAAPLLAKALNPYLAVLNAMPKVALGPIIIVIFGPNVTSPIAMGVLISISVTILVIYSAFRNVEPNYLKVLQAFGASRWQCYQQVVFPASLPTIISTLKVNVSLSWIGVIFGELLVSKQGLGYLISYGFQVSNFTLVLMSVILTCIFATMMYVLVEWLERLVTYNKS